MSASPMQQLQPNTAIVYQHGRWFFAYVNNGAGVMGFIGRDGIIRPLAHWMQAGSIFKDVALSDAESHGYRVVTREPYNLPDRFINPAFIP